MTRRTLNSVPTARIVTSPAWTRKGRSLSLATLKNASPPSRTTYRVSDVKLTKSWDLAPRRTWEPSGREISRCVARSVLKADVSTDLFPPSCQTAMPAINANANVNAVAQTRPANNGVRTGSHDLFGCSRAFNREAHAE